MKFKKLSTKIAVTILVVSFSVSLALSTVFQIRMNTRINEIQELTLVTQTYDIAKVCEQTFTDTMYSVKSLQKFIETAFNIAEYKNAPETYFESRREFMNDFIIGTIKKYESVSSAYFSVHPHISDDREVRQIFFEEDSRGNIESGDVETYEEFMDKSNRYMNWFWGAFDSGRPYWTDIFEWDDGNLLISHTTPVVINGEKIGVVGVDIFIDAFTKLIEQFTAYDTGFALLQDQYGVFLESDNSRKSFSDDGKSILTKAGLDNSGNVFNVRVDGIDYIATKNTLDNDYSVYVLVPANEFNAAVEASIMRFVLLFFPIFGLIVLVSLLVGKSISKPYYYNHKCN